MLTITTMIVLAVPGVLVYNHQTDWPPVVGGCNLLPESLMGGDKQISRPLELVAK